MIIEGITMRHRYLLSASVLALAPLAVSAHAQTAAPQNDTSATPADSTAPNAEASDIVVTGVRASLQSAQNIKRNADTIVDSIVSEDIGKLPDNNATEALQRITGVQVTRDLGEGSAIAIRGLPQVETTLNGRETFTAGGGRTFNLEDLPAELISRIDVYKAPTADLIEGGLGGLVDIRTHRPFDFDGFHISGTIKNDYADSVGKSKPTASLFVTDRWQTGIGEIGLLGSISYQDRAYRQDINSTGAPSPFLPGTAVPGETVFAPNGNYQPLIIGDRQRIGANAALQWRPAPNLEFNLEGQYQRFKTEQQQYAVNIPTAGGTVVPGSVSLFPGTNDVSKISYTNQLITASGTERDTLDKNEQLALNGKWTSGNFTLTGDASYSHSRSDLDYTELDLTTHAPLFVQDLTTSIPSSSTPGFDLSKLSNYTVGAISRNENHYVGHEWAGRLDGEYKFDSGFLKSIAVGGRFADRTVAQVDPIRNTAQTGATDPTLYPNLFQANAFDDFYTASNAGVDFQRNYPYASPINLKDNYQAVLNELGVVNANKGGINYFTNLNNDALAAFNADEKTYALYAMAKFGFNLGVPVDGNVGVRWVRTEDTIGSAEYATNPDGTQVMPQTVVPVTDDHSYSNWLPSANLRFHLTDKLQLRLSGSKTLTRPDFSQLSPALTVVPAQLAASSGNPDLQPIKSTNADVSLEWYFGRSSSLYVAGFYKRVVGFIFTRGVADQTIGDTTGYTISEPLNSGPGTVKGAEIGYQQFFDFLPGPLSGLGVQANFTYADSNAPTSLVGFTAPLTQLSKYSYNIAGIYEKNGISLRVAYNYRSSFLSSILTGGYTPPGQATQTYIFPVFTKGYGWLDATLNYDVTPHFTLTVDAQNILRTQIAQYYQVATQPGQYSIDDRQFMIGARFKF
jgi:TonB-dependent receptor